MGFTKPTDFNEATGVNTSPKTLLQLLIIEAWFNLNEAIEEYNIKKDKNQPIGNQVIYVRARLKKLIFFIQPWLKRSYKGYEDLIMKVNSPNIRVLMSAAEETSLFLDKKNLIKIDQDLIDFTDPDAEDEAKGYA